MEDFKKREIVRIMELTDEEKKDLQALGFRVMLIIGKLYEISVGTK